MAPIKKKKNELTKIQDIQLNKISIFFRRSILKTILRVLLMEHAGFRTFKSVKNINRLFVNLDLKKYQSSQELLAYIWCICYVSKQWLSGVTLPDIIVEMAKNQEDIPPLAPDILMNTLNDENVVTAPEAKAIFDLVAESLQYGYITTMKEEYISLLDDINLDEPGAFKKLTDRLFLVSKSLMDIRHNTNMVSSKVEFNTADKDSVKEAVSSTIEGLKGSRNVFKIGIRRFNTLLSPGYMNGRIYVLLGLPGGYKSTLLLKSAIDIRKYNPDYITKTPGMKAAVLYITMENTFQETIERMWNMTFDDPMIDYTPEEALEKLSKEMGLTFAERKTETEETAKKEMTLDDLINNTNIQAKTEGSNIELVIQYYPYRSINTDDLYTIIQDLRDENLEVCALVFDYIKRIEPSIPVPDNTKLELSRIMNELKALAVIQDIPVITAHQMNRTAAATVDAAVRQAKSDVNKLVGREHVGDAWEVIESTDFACVLNSEYKPGTEEKYLTVNVIKRRRIDSSDQEFAKYTYLAHPFARNNGLRLVDDIHLDKVLSLQSLSSDIDMLGVNKEKANMVPRLQTLQPSDFDEDY